MAEPTSTVKTELAWWIAHAEAILASPDAANYIPASKDNLTLTLENAKVVYANASATDAQLAAEIEKLQEAIWQLYEKGDKTELQKLYDMVKNYDETLYTTGSWIVFKAALDAAEDVLDNVNAIEIDVVEAYLALIQAESELELKNLIDFTALQSAITAGQNILNNKGDYVASTIVGLQGLVTNANTLLTKPGVTQQEVNAATNALRQAIAKARLKPDRSPLLSALTAAETLSLSTFTDDSAAALNALVASGNALMTQSDEAVTQEQINALAQQIRDAIAALAAKPAQSGRLSPVGTSGSAGSPETAAIAEVGWPTTAGDGTGQPTTAPEVSTGIEGEPVPATARDAAGSDSNGLLAALIGLSTLLSAAIGFIIFLLMKRRKEDRRAEGLS
jgi:hypothetical protein